MADRNRVFLCPGSRDWVEWKTADLKTAVDRYGVDGFYVDTSYIILPCANALHNHGWADEDGNRQTDYPTWSMREVWRRAYETVCQARGRAIIYAHHKAGCPAALAAFTTAFCDGEQYTGQSIRNLTLDAFRAQDAGRNMGPLAIFINEYYRSANYGLQKKAKHHNPTETLMLTLIHDVLPTGYPGVHPVRELMALRDDLRIADAAWKPYYAPDASWRLDGVEGPVVSSYTTSRGDVLLVVGNPTDEAARGQLVGPAAALRGRTFVAIDVLSRLGRSSAGTPGYRWEKASPTQIEVGARSFGLFAFVRNPQSLPGFAGQHGFIAAQTSRRQKPVPPDALLVSNFDDPDWVLVNDDGEITTTDAEPVDTARAMRVVPKPKHRAAALLRSYPEPQNWSAYGALTLWVRPQRPLPARALQVRLRDAHGYGPALKLATPALTGVLPAGEWTELRYVFGDVPRHHVRILRVYFHRGELCSGPFDVDEMMLHRLESVLRGEERQKGSDNVENQPVPD